MPDEEMVLGTTVKCGPALPFLWIFFYFFCLALMDLPLPAWETGAALVVSSHGHFVHLAP